MSTDGCFEGYLCASSNTLRAADTPQTCCLKPDIISIIITHLHVDTPASGIPSIRGNEQRTAAIAYHQPRCNAVEDVFLRETTTSLPAILPRLTTTLPTMSCNHLNWGMLPFMKDLEFLFDRVVIHCWLPAHPSPGLISIGPCACFPAHAYRDTIQSHYSLLMHAMSTILGRYRVVCL